MFEYQSAWEQLQNLPAGTYLYRRSMFPEYLSTAEISSLFTEDPSEQVDLKKLLDNAIQNNDLHAGYISIESVPANPYEVIQSMRRHIQLVEEKLQQLEKDVRQTFETNLEKIDQDIYKTRKDILSVLRCIVKDSISNDLTEKHDLQVRNKLNGDLLQAKTRMPIRGAVGIGYEKRKTSECIKLVNSVEKEKWLKATGEWPLPNHIPLSRWFLKKQKKNGRLLANTIRQEVLKLVAQDLKKEGINPLRYPGRAEDVYELCRIKAISEYPNSGAFTQFSTWRSKFWNFEKSRFSRGIIELADSRGKWKK